MFTKLWDFVVDSLIVFFSPLVCTYFACTSNVFLNVSCNEANYLEKLGNQLLTPCHYLFVGQQAYKDTNGEWVFSNRFEYETHFIPKTIGAVITVVPSFFIGTSIKALSLLTPSSFTHNQELTSARAAHWTQSNLAKYATCGIETIKSSEWLQAQGHHRRAGDENNLHHEKEALRQVGALFDEAGIPWWVDCGTCLGAYRYGGVIPWDEDVDIAILMPDFDNAIRILNKLDPADYLVQDWSTREHPKSSIKIYVRKNRNFIDIYNFKILPETKQIQYVLAIEHAFFWPDWVKIREGRFTAPISFDAVFPLKKALFDGMIVNVPCQTEKYLQRYYGENLAPAKVFDPQTNQYERDLSHPYWQRAFVH